MDGQCHKSCLLLDLIGLKMHLSLIKILQKIIMKFVIKDNGDVLFLETLHEFHDGTNENWKSWKTCSQFAW